jgi:hypothetical protein
MTKWGAPGCPHVEIGGDMLCCVSTSRPEGRPIIYREAAQSTPARSPHVAAIEDAYRIMRDAMVEAIARYGKINFGWDGDCGCDAIFADLDNALDRAEASQGGAKAK